ncbi:MAG: hypothetical protein V4590_03350 [Bacteroidota bacterium]
MEEKVTLIARRKSIQIVFDYAMDLKIPFQVSARGISADEFEIDLTINGIKQAVALGMFVKEHKFEVSGLGELAKVKMNGNGSKKPESKENGLGSLAEVVSVTEEPAASVLNF